jgi:hypothetical protein
MDTIRLLRRALTRTGQTAGTFAQSIGKGYSTAYLYAVANGTRQSSEISRAIDELVAPEVEADRAASGLALAA